MSGQTNLRSVSVNDLGNLVEKMTGNELKVMLFLALQTNGFALSADGIRVRQIAAGTKLSKKEVRVALRVLTVNAAFSGRFQISAPASRFPQATRETSDKPISVSGSIA